MKGRKYKILLFLIITLSVGLKGIYTIFFLDISNIEYYEYGELAKNLHAGNGFSLFHLTENNIDYHFSVNAKPFPSAYMPPAYTYYLYPFFYLNSEEVRNYLIILSQIIISVIITLVLFKICIQLFNEKVALVAALIYTILPDFMYAATHINVVLLYHLGLLLIFLFLERIKQQIKMKEILLLSIATIFIIYLRMEMFFAALIISIYLLTCYKKKYGILFSILIILSLLPWQIRNYQTFNKFIPFTTSAGLNLYRGHNPYEIGSWGDEKLKEKLINFSGENYEIKADSLYRNLAIDHILKNPLAEIKNSAIKIFNLWIYNFGFPRPGNKINFLLWMPILLLGIFGMIKSFSWQKFKFIYVFLILFNLLAVVFFALPRYQTMMKIAIIPFAAFGIITFIGWIKNRPGKTSLGGLNQLGGF